MEEIRETDLTNLILLLNRGASIELELACEFIHISNNELPVYHPGNVVIFLDGKAKKDFDLLCNNDAIGGKDLGKPYLVGLCLWNSDVHGEQPEKGKLLAKQFGIGHEFIGSELRIH